MGPVCVRGHGEGEGVVYLRQGEGAGWGLDFTCMLPASPVS
jgi:hypothetical protein